MKAHEVGKLQNEIEAYAKLDGGDEYGEYTNWLVELGSRWDMMSPSMEKAYTAELKRVLKNYKQNYVIEEIEGQPMPRTHSILRYTGNDY